DDLPKRWRKDQTDLWANVWVGLIGGAARAPALDLARDAARITRAITDADEGKLREFILIQTRNDVTPVIRSISKDKSFERRTVGGLAVWEKPDLAVARVGPTTLAVGTSSEVDTLVEVRLGMQPDLRISGSLFEHFQTAERDSSLRLISRDPPHLSRVFHPVFTRELLDASQLIGLVLNLQNPVQARVFLRTQSPERAQQLAHDLQSEPQRWLRLPDSELQLFAHPPEITRADASIELRFPVPENSARLVLQRLAKADTSSVVAAQPTGAQ
ncbi:MAG: hypothetical protein QOI34_1934, partial [Verrucomicrobiota bacterium]